MYIEETDSTSSLLRRLLTGTESEAERAMRACLDEPVPCIYTPYQTGGRGQTGNGWESKRGENLLFSFVLRRPPVAVSEQFRLSEWLTVLLHQTLLEFLPKNSNTQNYSKNPTDLDTQNFKNSDTQKLRKNPTFPEPLPNQLAIKWPNDIYFGDRKLVGILVENTLQGREIAYSIIGIGVNCNQTHWEGNAPNPISLQQIVGHTLDPETILARYMQRLTESYAAAVAENQLPDLHAYYRQVLYRGKGYYPYLEREVSVVPTAIATRAEAGQQTFDAEVVDITPQGELLLRTREGEERMYHFKQVKYIIN